MIWNTMDNFNMSYKLRYYVRTFYKDKVAKRGGSLFKGLCRKEYKAFKDLVKQKKGCSNIKFTFNYN